MKQNLKRRAVALTLVLASSTLHALPVYINEFHYDNQGTDQNEFVEIAGLAGTELSGWQLEFYNGGNGQRYMTWDLSGYIADQQQGYGTLAFNGSRGIQNGGSDGIALVDNSGSLVQFLSYEGELTASNGSAEGQTSVDIGVFEAPSSDLGQSVQLSGSGENSEAFVWRVAAASAGDFNLEQSYTFSDSASIPRPVPEIDLVIPALDPAPVVLPESDASSQQWPISGGSGNSSVAVPEPAALSLLGLGLLALGYSRRRAV